VVVVMVSGRGSRLNDIRRLMKQPYGLPAVVVVLV
jgi:hypothetical protein